MQTCRGKRRTRGGVKCAGAAGQQPRRIPGQGPLFIEADMIGGRSAACPGAPERWRGVPGSSGAMAQRAEVSAAAGSVNTGPWYLRVASVAADHLSFRATPCPRRQPAQCSAAAPPVPDVSRRLPTSPDLRATPGGSRRCARSRSRPGPAACGAAAGSRCRPRARRPRGLLRPRPGRAARSARAGGRAP